MWQRSMRAGAIRSGTRSLLGALTCEVTYFYRLIAVFYLFACVRLILRGVERR
jgi:hypothetical protein